MWANTDFLFRGEKMADKRVSIVFDAKMEIGGIKKALDEINKLTSNPMVNLPKGIASNFNKTI
jgi:hypothetical protein